jgi:fructose-bisphosphate aldolase, class I
MDSRTGKKIRMGRIFNHKSNKTLIMAYSHGVLMGPLPGMKTLAEMKGVVKAVSGADALMVTPGMLTLLEDAFIGKNKPALFLHWDYQSYIRKILPYQVGATTELGQVEDALSAGADAIMSYLFIGHDDPEAEKLEIAKNVKLARDCERMGLVFMVEVMNARVNTHPEDQGDKNFYMLSCRIAAEIGADIVKCQPPQDLKIIKEIAETCPVPLVLAGGAKTEKPEMAYEIARSTMEAGAAGLVFGRNIFEAPDPAKEVRLYQKIIHGY